MKDLKKSIQSLNMPKDLKVRMSQFIESQQTKKLDSLKENLNVLKSDSNYKCSKCRDMTIIIEDNEARFCECRAIRESDDILKRSGISSEFRNKTFDNFNYFDDVQIMNAYKSSVSYVRDFESIEKSKNNSIMFMGQVGSGKTHLSLAIANCLIDKGIGVLYMGYRESIIRIKQNIMDQFYYHREMNRFKNCRVLLIDDLFKGSVTGSDINVMFEIVNYRYFNGLPVIVSCEKGVGEILDIDEGVGSRLVEMCKGRCVEIRGKRLNYRVYG